MVSKCVLWVSKHQFGGQGPQENRENGGTMLRCARVPLKFSQLPDYQPQTAESDLFELNGDYYRLVKDYFIHFPAVIKLKSTTSRAIISALKAIFSRFGYSEIQHNDRGL